MTSPSRASGHLLFGALLAAALAAAASCDDVDVVVPAACYDGSSTEIFDRRIAPLLRDDRPKSCNACHLSGIDMSLFVRPTPCETMACLTDLGLVDLREPRESTVLSWIQRAAPLSPLITADVVQAEHDGFLEWIEHHAECNRFECSGVRCTERSSDPFCDVEPEPLLATGPQADDGGCSELSLERLFRESIYASRQRCFPCHFDSEQYAAPNALRFIEQGTTCEASSLATMRNILDAGLVNVALPERSLLLLKPLSEENGGVPHGGHAKFFPGSDPGYDNFLYWVQRYAACQNGKG